VNKTETFEWFLKFKSKITFAEDAECLWIPPMSRVVKNVLSIRKFVHGNCYHTVIVALQVYNAVWACTSSHDLEP
jgi:hypothetical protein